MSDQIPLKVIRTAGDTTALGEFEVGEEVGIVHGGTGADTAPDARTNLAVPPNTLVLTAGDGLSGGGDLTADRSFAVNVQKSIEIDTDILQLTNDLTSPGNDQVYGTDGAGVKGWKADPAGGGGGSGSFTFTSKRLKVDDTTYKTKGRFVFQGSTVTGTPTLIKIIAEVSSGSTGSVRLFDATNSLVIAEKTGISSTTPSIVDMGTISNVPTGEAIFEIQLRNSLGEVDDDDEFDTKLYSLRIDF